MRLDWAPTDVDTLSYMVDLGAAAQSVKEICEFISYYIFQIFIKLLLGILGY